MMKSALLLIDIQNDYFPGGKSELCNPMQAVANAKQILHIFRTKGLPVFHVQHINNNKDASFFIPDTEGVKIHTDVSPVLGEKIFIKHKPNSFFETSLNEELKNSCISHLVVCGMMTHMCIDTTVRAAQDYGFTVTVLQDACTTKDLTFEGKTIGASVVHDVFLASLQKMFAEIVSTQEFIAMANSEQFN